MPQNFELRIPNNGMNRDDESRLIESNESRFIVNLRSGSSEDSNVGGLENIKGTTEISYDFPQGRNVCIGSEGDQPSGSNYFFMFNSLGDHGVYVFESGIREIRALVIDPLLAFTEEDLINDINIIDGLLYWANSANPQRKINISKADVDKESFRQVFHYYLGDKYIEPVAGFNSSRGIDFEIKTKRYDTSSFLGQIEIVLDQSLIDNKKELAKDVANQFNAITSLNGVPTEWNATACGEFVKITINSSDFYSMWSLDQNGVKNTMVLPQNHYQGYIERTIDVIKHPPHCNPTAELKSNDTFERNFVKEKVFQFATSYVYDDNEKTVVSPYSPNIYNPFTCEYFAEDIINNYIEIKLDVYPELFILKDLQTLKRIDLFVKEGELGLWKKITSLEQYEFVDISETHFDFYNNFKYNEVDQEAFIRQYHNVPILSKTQDAVKNRLFYANNLEQQDPTCIDANIDVEYDDVESRVKPPTHSVSGILMIRAMFNGNLPDDDSQSRSPSKNQAIRKDGNPDDFGDGSGGGTSTSTTVWGGISEGAGNDPEVWDMAEKTGQTLPLDGFTVYLAGTDYYDITNQNTGEHKSNVGQNTKGVYQNTGDSDMNTLVNKIRENMREDDGFGLDLVHWRENADFSYPDGGSTDPTQAFSTFNIPNVPDGWYIMRVASHLTTDEDLKDPERGWQRTSTNTYLLQNLDAVENNSIAGGRKAAQKGRSELLIQVKGGNIPRIKIEVMDMSHASDQGSSKIMTGYLSDRDNNNLQATYSNIFNDNRVAAARVSFDINPNDTASDVNFNIFPSSAYCSGATAITDYNGYFYYGSIDSGGELSLCSDGIRGFGFLGAGTIVERTGRNYTNIDEDNYAEVAIRIDSSASNKRRVKVIGNTEDNTGKGIPKASVVSIGSETARADLKGEYQFWHYDIKETSAGNPIGKSTYLIPIRETLNCSIIYDENDIYNYDFNYGDWVSDTSLQVPSQSSSPNAIPLELTIDAFVGDVSNQQVINAPKRGWDGKYGLVYYDRGLRSSAVNTDKGLELHIPFYTEKDSDGLIKTGVPIVNWEIKHAPPSWATHYQWVRTRNETLGSYVQWAINAVRYTDVDDVTTPYNSATRVSVSINNITEYKDKFPTLDFQVAIDSETWRIRFIKDQSGTPYTEYNDYKIISFSAASGKVVFEKDFDLPELGSGVLVELYDEKADIEEEIFFEFAECFEIGTDINGNKYHKGLEQDQDPINPSITPATGHMRTGDAYYRLRYIPEGSPNTPAYIDDDAVSDFYHSEVESIGRANGINPDFFQKWKPNQIRHGGKYVPDSNVNNLSLFESDNFQPLPIGFGDINKLQLASNVLLSIHEFRWVSNYIEEGIIRKQNGTNEIVASTKVFDSYRAAKPITGTINPESIKEFRGKVYGYDMNKGLVNKYDVNGLGSISSYKFVDFFSDISKAIMNSKNSTIEKSRVLGYIDTKRDEYMLSFNDLHKKPEETSVEIGSARRTVNIDVSRSEIINGGTNETLYSINAIQPSNNLIFDTSKTLDLQDVQIDNKVDSSGTITVKVLDINGIISNITELSPGQGIANFNTSNGSFVTKRVTTDSSKTIFGDEDILIPGLTISYSEKFNKWTTFYSFKPIMFGDINLEMLGFTEGKLWIHNDSEIRNNFYGTQYSSIIETIFNDLPNNVKVFEAVGVDSYFEWNIPKAFTTNGMETVIVAERFVKKEDSFYAPMMRDKNDPLAESEEDGIINGRKLRDRTVQVTFENSDTKEIVLFSVSMKSTISTRHQK